MQLVSLWLVGLAKLIVYLAVFAFTGYVVGEITLLLSLGIGCLLGWQYWQLYRLNDWLQNSKKISPPKSRGIWTQIYQGIYTTNLNNRNKRKTLGETIRRFRHGSEALPDAALVVDDLGEIVWCNRLARIELGLNWPADLGRKIDECINDQQFKAFYLANRFEQPLEISSPINADKVLEFRMVPYADYHLMVVIRDVTRLTQIEKMRKDFVANVSHELKTPLTVINGYLEMLPEDVEIPAPVMQKAITEMRSQSLRMQSLIEELLVLSRIEASTERVFEKLVNVPKMLWQIQAEADAVNREHQHKLFFDIAPVLFIYGIESELRSAFSNLIFNAINYTPNGGVIEVTWSLINNNAQFSVKDNGEGVAAEHMERLTERFYRVDKARSRTTGGSGLGLSIVKHVLSHHNSVLHINSKLGKGSTFSCCFAEELVYLHEAPVKFY